MTNNRRIKTNGASADNSNFHDVTPNLAFTYYHSRSKKKLLLKDPMCLKLKFKYLDFLNKAFTIYVETTKGEICLTKVERLLINYKTLEEFKKFKEYGIQELSMLEELQDNIIENDSTSPFYGIYFGDKLVARMSLYQVNGKSNPYFDNRQDYLELWKLEVLPGYQNRGYGRAFG